MSAFYLATNGRKCKKKSNGRNLVLYYIYEKNSKKLVFNVNNVKDIERFKPILEGG
jgi:hypothetical protein